jgi:hypothetical protein
MAAKPSVPPVYRPFATKPPVARAVNLVAKPQPMVAQASRNPGTIVQRSRPVAGAVERRPAPPVYRPQAAIGVQPKRPSFPIKPLQNRSLAPAVPHGNPTVTVQRMIQRAPQPATRNGSAVQRKLEWIEGGRAKVKNLADCFLRFLDFGVTPILLNDQEFPGGGNLKIALHGPAFLIDLQDDHVELSVAAEIINCVGYRMELPSAGPWTAQKDIKKVSDILVDAQHSAIDKDLLGDGTATVTVEAVGMPDNSTFADRVERHENWHVDDIKEKVKAILDPWDKAMTKFMKEGKTIVAETSKKAEEKFYEQVGGTPEQIATKFVNALRMSGNAFHGTTKGKSPWIDSYTVAFNTVRVYWDMPKL